MDISEHSLALLGIVLFIGLLIPALLERFRVPFASALILLGAVLGPHGLDTIRPDRTLLLFGFLGGTFQMLIAGFESHELELRFADRDSSTIFALNGLLPGAVGAALGFYVGRTWQSAALVAAIFLSSSILLVFSFVRHFHIDETPLGRRLKAAAVMQDLASTVVAFLILNSAAPHERFPLPILLGLILGSVAVLRMFAPEVAAFAFSSFDRRNQSTPEPRIRLILSAMLLLLFLYAALDVPSIVAAFLVGFALAGIDRADELRERLHLIGYALFIPVFFITVGLNTNLAGLFAFLPDSVVFMSMVLLAIGSKVVGGLWAGTRIGLERRDAWALGVGSSVKLTVPITATYAALQEQLIAPSLYSAAVVVTVVSATVVPPLLEFILRSRGARDPR